MTLAMRLALTFGLAICGLQIAHAQDIPKIKQTRLGLYLTAVQAADAIKSARGKVLLVDVRTRAEIQFVGYATEIDGLVPFVEMSQFADWDDANSRYKLEPNAAFSDGVGRLLAAKGLSKSDMVILMCRSGDRSSRAADLLQDAGFSKVYSILDGFEGDLSSDGRRTVNGWRNAGLPWTYKLDKSKVYAPLN